MKGNFHVRFLGERVAAMSLPYPTMRKVTLNPAHTYRTILTSPNPISNNTPTAASNRLNTLT